MKISIVALLLCLPLFSSAQLSYYNPENESAQLWGQLLRKEKRTNYYHRLPDSVTTGLRKVVWELSKNSAGESLKFYTNSTKIIVKYTVAEALYFPHMPTTGKSGVDLYAYDAMGKEKFCAAKYNFNDTISYSYQPIYYNNLIDKKGYEYQLWLPLYNTVKWLEIGVEEGAYLKFINPLPEKPIIAYGTSITQGACASRPGMAWSSILSRCLCSEVVNLGFSGNAHMEKEIIEIIQSTPAKIIIIDCLPNMIAFPDQIKHRLIEAVKTIRKTQPATPILLTDHPGYPHSNIIEKYEADVLLCNKLQKEAYDELLAVGEKELYYLSRAELAMPIDATVEGTHPSDYGMRIYANAYEKKIREILKIRCNRLDLPMN